MSNLNNPVSNEEFEEILEERLQSIKDTLGLKAIEYVRNEDRLHNFNVAAEIENHTREDVIWGMALKHFVSFKDMLYDIRNDAIPDEQTINEKLGDLINYFILIECSIKNKLNR